MRPTALIWLLGVALVGCGRASGIGSASSGAPTGAPVTASIAAGVPTVVDESTVDKTLQSGKATVLLFMATGCSSCAAQATALAAAGGGHETVQLVGVDISGADDAATLRSFVADAQLGSLPITWTVDRDGHLALRYQVQALDETVGLINGTVHFHNASSVDAAQLRRQIEGLA